MVKTRALALICVASILLAACGSRSNEAAPTQDPGLNGGNATTGSTAAGGGDGGGGEDFGTLPNPCGENETGAELTESDLGVTADEITITTISDPGGAKPGLNQGMFDAMVAFADWCNGFGGINGREVNVVQRDAKIFEYQQRVTEACGDSFALVGGLGVTDSLGAQTAIDCGLVNVPGAAVSAQQTDADRTYQPLPNPIQQYQAGSGEWIAENFPDAPPQAALIYQQVPAVKYQADRQIEAYTSLGYTFLSNDAANVGETNWGPLVVNLKNEGAKYFTAVSAFEELVPLQKEMGAQGYTPEITELQTNFYTAKYPELAKEQGANVDNTYVRLTTWPFEEADARPAMQMFLDALQAAVPDAVPEQLGVQAFSAGLLFATAAKAAGADLTRDKLITELSNIHEWDGGGLHGVSDPGNNGSSSCFIMMKVSYDGFTREYPLPEQDKDVYEAGEGMACPTDAMVTLKGDYGTGAREH
jgi:ABC-type branched-subunit amino acid transport system substrate-binding protein